MRLGAQEAARAFLQAYFPDCLAALLAGSVVRGEATSTSDLDIVIFTERDNAPYRKSFEAYGWPIEAFVYTPSTYGDFFAGDVRRRRPSLPLRTRARGQGRGKSVSGRGSTATLSKGARRDALRSDESARRFYRFGKLQRSSLYRA